MQKLCIISRNSLFNKTKTLLLHDIFDSSHAQFVQISSCTTGNPDFVRVKTLHHLQPLQKKYFSDLREDLLSGKSSPRSKILKTINYDELKNQLKLEKNQALKSSKILGESQEFAFQTRLNRIVKERCNDAIAEFDEEENKKLDLMKLELDFLFSDGQEVLSPSAMDGEQWLEILQIKSRSKRLKTFTFFFKRAMIKQNSKAEEKILKKKRKQSEKSRNEVYPHGKLFHRIYPREILKRSNSRLASEMMLGTPLIFDFDYVQYMRPEDIRNTAKQMSEAYVLNRSQINPYHLYFVNCPEDNDTYKHLLLLLAGLEHFMVTVTEKSYLEIFDKKKLVYLSPHAGQSLEEVDPHKVCIIGAFNDKGIQKNISYVRAKQEGIACAKLPLDQYLDWRQGNKSLTLCCMMKIMNTYKNTEQWEQAFKAIPKRALY